MYDLYPGSAALRQREACGSIKRTSWRIIACTRPGNQQVSTFRQAGPSKITASRIAMGELQTEDATEEENVKDVSIFGAQFDLGCRV